MKVESVKHVGAFAPAGHNLVRRDAADVRHWPLATIEPYRPTCTAVKRSKGAHYEVVEPAFKYNVMWIFKARSTSIRLHVLRRGIRGRIGVLPA